MVTRKLLLLFVLLAPFIQSCATAYKESITSDPPGADIYWGYSQSHFVDTEYTTPFERSLYGKMWEARCYQVKKSGYYDSEVICKPRETGNRTIHFSMRSKPLEKVEPPETEEQVAVITNSKITEESRVSLREAIKEKTPSLAGPAAKYMETSLRGEGHRTYAEIVPSHKYPNKYAIVINRYFSEGQFNKDNLTETAIIAAAILCESVAWSCSDLYLDYSAIFMMDDRSVGWAIISVEDCMDARSLLMSTNSNDTFTTHWKSKIHYISDTDPQPDL